MSKTTLRKPLGAAIGAAFVTSLAATPMAGADSNPFAAQQLPHGYMVADAGEGKCGASKQSEKAKEGKCGESKTTTEGKCGTGKVATEGKCGETKPAAKAVEAKCGEAKCGAKK